MRIARNISRSLQNGTSYTPPRNDDSAQPVRSAGFPQKTARSEISSAGTRLAQYSPGFPGGLVVMKRIILAAMIEAVTACGGNASLSPVGPSSSSAGASISGTVSGNAVTATHALDGGTFGMLASSSETVSIAGTKISTTPAGQGQFTLNNVPAGTVTLNFTAPGSSATITLTGIGPDDKVQIQATLNGNNARVNSEHHSSPGNDKKEVQ